MFEYAVVIRKQKRGHAPTWQLWVGAGLAHSDESFLALMNFAGARGFEAFAAGNFDDLGVPEVLMKRSVAMPPPPPLPKAKSAAGGELAAASARPKRAPAKRTKSSAAGAKKKTKKGS